MILDVNIENKLSSFKLDVNFTQENGVLGLLGASGSGKSMTLKAISGILTPTSGNITLGDKVFFDSNKKINLSPQQRKIGYVFQNYALFPNMNVIENISSGLHKKSAEVRKELCSDYINKFRLNGLEKNYPSELSGGQCQRVALARALITNPDILLLDEPFSALDNHLKSEIERDFLKIIKEYNGIVIYVTHDISEAYRICDNIIAYDSGKAYNKRLKKEIFNSPQNLTEAKLTGIKNISTATIKDNKVIAKDWGCDFTLDKNITNINYICFRENDISISNEEDKNSTYLFRITNILDNPFDTILFVENINNKSKPIEIKVSNDIDYKIGQIVSLEFNLNKIIYF